MIGSISSAPDPSQGAGGFALVGILGFVFLIYSIVLLVFCCLPGTRGPNRFGEDPYGQDVGEVFA